MTIKHPTTAQIPCLRSLWQEAFGDTDGYLDDFFHTAFAPERCLTLWMDNTLAAALYWLDCSCREEPCAYLYAVATAKAYRGKGLCHRLLAQTEALLTARGYTMTILVPARQELFSFYNAMGYQPFGGIREHLCPAGAAAVTLTPISAVEYAAQRRILLPPGSVLQEGATLDFLQTQGAFYKGDGFILCAQREEDSLFVPELLGQADPGGILGALSCREGTFRTPGIKPFAMAKRLSPGAMPEYFSFALD